MRVSEIRVKRIRVNKGLGVYLSASKSGLIFLSLFLLDFGSSDDNFQDLRACCSKIVSKKSNLNVINFQHIP